MWSAFSASSRVAFFGEPKTFSFLERRITILLAASTVSTRDDQQIAVRALLTGAPISPCNSRNIHADVIAYLNGSVGRGDNCGSRNQFFVVGHRDCCGERVIGMSAMIVRRTHQDESMNKGPRAARGLVNISLVPGARTAPRPLPPLRSQA
jgi:hypothetical protein